VTRHRALLIAGLFIAAATVSPAAAQVGHTPANSPYLDLEHSQALTLIGGQYHAHRDPADVGPQSGFITGLHYEWRGGGAGAGTGAGRRRPGAGLDVDGYRRWTVAGSGRLRAVDSCGRASAGECRPVDVSGEGRPVDVIRRVPAGVSRRCVTPVSRNSSTSLDTLNNISLKLPGGLAFAHCCLMPRSGRRADFKLSPAASHIDKRLSRAIHPFR
jgi:hypothetical protein